MIDPFAAEGFSGRGAQDPPMVHLGDAVRDVEGILAIVRDDDSGGVVLAQDAQYLVTYGGPCFRIEVAERLVHEHQAGTAHERSGDGDTLLLPSAEFVGIAPAKAFQTHRVQFIRSALFAFSGGQAMQPEGHIPINGQMREEGKALENETDTALLGRNEGVLSREEVITQAHVACRWFFKAGDHAQERGLSTAAGAYDDKRFALAQ